MKTGLKIGVISLLLASVAMFSTAQAAFSKVATTGANFLKISVGRASGMGDAFTALADDASATWFNPAGLAHIKRQAQMNHANWFADLNHDYLTVVLPVTNFGTLGIWANALTMGEIEQTTVDDPKTPVCEDEGTGLTISANDLAFGLSYARIITDKLSIGLTVKGVQQTIWDMGASGIGIDFGLFYNTGFKSLRLGAAITNFGTQLAFSGPHLDYNFYWPDSGPTQLQGSYKTTPSPLPTAFRFGVAMDLLQCAPNRLTAAIDIVHPSDINETVNIGLEYGLSEILFLRGGYILNVDQNYQEKLGYLTGLCAGIGVKGKPTQALELGLDYSFRYYQYIKPAHRLMLTVGF
uniref:PorV/PorQ family protein n=1 Tax=candidate division WOR-3 bacterium TaxID=2052148 RepID=A0A7V3PU92_UNCW3